MNYDQPMAEEPGLLKTLALGDYAQPAALFGRGSMLAQSVMISGMINPAVGAGLFFPPAMFAAEHVPFLKSPLMAPLTMGHFNLGGSIAARTMKSAAGISGTVDTMGGMASLYWKNVAARTGAKSGAAASAKWAPGGAWSDKFFSWMAPKETLAQNRLIMGMLRKEVAEGGLAAGLKAAGWGASLGSKIGAAARLGGMGAGRMLPLVGWGMFAYDVFQAGRGLYNAVDQLAQARHRQMTSETATPFVDNMHTMTERRRALGAIQQSRMNARSAFGYEAKRLHM